MNKKNLFFSLLILPALILVACGKDETLPGIDERVTLAQDEKLVLSIFEGEIQPIEDKNVYQKGTHLLRVDDESIFIQSRVIDLSDYIGRQVQIEGQMQKGIGSTESVLNVESVEYLSESEVGEYAAYQNELFGLGFEHPSEWLLNGGGEVVILRFEEEDLVKITAFTGQGDLDEVAGLRETDAPTEVTVGAQRALRYISGANITVYVPNPPKDRVYQITFAPTLGDDLDKIQSQFYEMLKSIVLYSMSELDGKVCGGEPPIACDEGDVCQLQDGSDFAEGVCVSIDATLSGSSCPKVSLPADCSEYRIADYTTRGCPSRYACVADGESLNPNELGDFESSSVDAKDSLSDEEYVVPSADDITQSYVNEKQGFKVLLPKEWYYASFGPVDGTVLTVGFLDEELEGIENALVTMAVQNTGGGQASKKIGDLYYVFEGPADLTSVMEAMADSVEEVEVKVE